MHRWPLGGATQRWCSPSKVAIMTSLHSKNHRAHLKNFKALAFYLPAGTHRKSEANPATSTAHCPRDWLKDTRISNQPLFKLVKSAGDLFIKLLKCMSEINYLIFPGSRKETAQSCNPCENTVFSFPKPHTGVKQNSWRGGKSWNTVHDKMPVYKISSETGL